MAILRDVPLGQPRLHWSELDDETPSYYKLLAAPSQDTLVAMWASMALVNILVSFVIATIFLAVLAQPKVRRKPFNLYLLFLMLPDFFQALMSCITCWLSAAYGAYWSSAMCRWQAVYMVFGIASKGWLSFLATYQVHRLLISSKQHTKYSPPGPEGVICQSLWVYVFSLFLSALTVIPQSLLPHDLDVQFGFMCLPLQNNGRGGFYFYAIFLPLFTLIPTGYMVFCFADVYIRGLLPRDGSKSRRLTLYFFSIDFVFVFCWVPALIVYYGVRGIHPTGMFAIALLAHIHGAIAAMISTRKPDIQSAVSKFLRRGLPNCFAPIINIVLGMSASGDGDNDPDRDDDDDGNNDEASPLDFTESCSDEAIDLQSKEYHKRSSRLVQVREEHTDSTHSNSV